MGYRVVIVGGGPAGIACALTLEAAKRQNLLDSGSSVTVMDAGHSDLLAAALREVPGLSPGIHGKDLLGTMHAQLQAMGGVYIVDTVTHLFWESAPFRLSTASGREEHADLVVLAAGYKHFELSCEPGLPTKMHPYSPKQRTCLVTDQEHRVAPGIYAAGNLGGEYSMFAVAIGSGTAVACQILSDLAGKPILVHDTV